MSGLVPDEESSSSSDDALEFDKVDVDELKRETEALAAFLKGVVDKEIARLREHDVKALPLRTKTVVTTKDGDGQVVHEVEVATAMDFNTIQSIFIGPTSDVALKPGFSAVLLMLWTEKGFECQMPLMVGVILPTECTSSSDTMRAWRFINDTGQSVQHLLDATHDVTADNDNDDDE
jgi:hypothetical protein